MKDKIIYQLSVEDIYGVCDQVYNRKPTKAEIRFIEKNIGGYIAWFDAIENSLIEYQTRKDFEKKDNIDY